VQDELFDAALRDTVQARQLHSHGGYLPVAAPRGAEPFSAQTHFMLGAIARSRGV
jgi:hypothetical protein